MLFFVRQFYLHNFAAILPSFSRNFLARFRQTRREAGLLHFGQTLPPFSKPTDSFSRNFRQFWRQGSDQTLPEFRNYFTKPTESFSWNFSHQAKMKDFGSFEIRTLFWWSWSIVWIQTIESLIWTCIFAQKESFFPQLQCLLFTLLPRLITLHERPQKWRFLAKLRKLNCFNLFITQDYAGKHLWVDSTFIESSFELCLVTQIDLDC